MQTKEKKEERERSLRKWANYSRLTDDRALMNFDAWPNRKRKHETGKFVKYRCENKKINTTKRKIEREREMENEHAALKDPVWKITTRKTIHLRTTRTIKMMKRTTNDKYRNLLIILCFRELFLFEFIQKLLNFYS